MIPASSIEPAGLRCRRDVYRFTRRQGLRHEDAEDVAQDVVFRLWRGGFLGGGHRLAFVVARRVTASFLRRELARKRDRRRQVVLEDRELAGAPGADRTCEAREEARRILAAMKRLERDPGIRVLQLRLEGRSYQEIARRLGRRVHDVTNHLHMVRSRLKAELGRLDRTSPISAGPAAGSPRLTLPRGLPRRAFRKERSKHR